MSKIKKFFNDLSVDIFFIIGLLFSFVCGILMILQIVISNDLTSDQYWRFSLIGKVGFAPIAIFVVTYTIIDFLFLATIKLKISKKLDAKIAGNPNNIFTSSSFLSSYSGLTLFNHL